MNSLFEEQLGKLRNLYPEATAELRPDGSRLIRIPKYPLPKPGWNADSTTIYFVVLASYPMARPDCFWTEPNLRLASGGPPQNTSVNNSAGTIEQLLWFSWHPSTWNPNTDDLLTYVRVIDRRLQELK